MVVDEIIEKDNLDVNEMAHVVEEYIYKMKGRRIKIGVSDNLMMLPIEIQLLNHAYNYAVYYFKNGHPIQKPV